MFKFSLSFFRFRIYFFLLNLSCLLFNLFVYSNLCILYNTLKLSLSKAFLSTSSGEKPYFTLGLIFILAVEISIIFLGEIFNFWLFNFAILVFSSLFFCSAANAFPPLKDVENMVTLFNSFKSFSLVYFHLLKFLIYLQPHFFTFSFASNVSIKLFKFLSNLFS